MGAFAGAGVSPFMAMEQTIAKAEKPLKILFLGGTGFLGPHTVQYAIDRGHEVTLFNRGRSKEVLFPELEKIIGNRDPEIDQGLEPLAGRQWDCVIDTSAYVPRIAEASAQLLADKCQQYLFVSTISVYAGFSEVGMKETAPVGTLEDTTVEVVDGATYGPLKAYCEQAVQKHFGERSTIVRPGLIVGPRDRTDRYTYWPVRMARGGQVLGPGDGTDKVQYIDVRDLGMFMIHCLENRTTGVFNTISDSATETVADMLGSCAEASGSDAETVWVDTDFLTEKGIRPWADLPVWVPNQGEMAGLSQVDVSKALAAGLTFRPRIETARDTLTWFQSLPAERQQTLRAGMKAEQEQEVIKQWLAKNPVTQEPMNTPTTAEVEQPTET
jgi:2'-hydroxyisoflavone reductase